LAAINAALFWRRGPGGTGQYLDISLIDFYFHTHGLSVELHSLSGGEIKPHRSGRYHTQLAPAGVFRSREGYMVLVPVSEDMWRRLTVSMGREDLQTDPRFATNAARMANRDALVAIIESWLAAQPSDEAALDVLRRGRVPCAPVLSVAQAMRLPHLLERGTVRTVQDPVLGSFQVPGSPLNFSAFPTASDLVAPDLGQHNEEILTRWAGLAVADIERLAREGVIHASLSGRQ
jgi:crotonobetainyl-CoA:carnitine CoA-transferase CaiB-like acyl-CoA transferase